LQKLHLKSESEAAPPLTYSYVTMTIRVCNKLVRSHLDCTCSPHHKRKAINFVLGMKNENEAKCAIAVIYNSYLVYP
jgi:hypothetical protein